MENLVKSCIQSKENISTPNQMRIKHKKKMDILIEMPAVFFYNSHLMSFYGSVMRTRDPWIVMNESSHRKYFWKVYLFLTDLRELKIYYYYTHKINRVLQII